MTPQQIADEAAGRLYDEVAGMQTWHEGPREAAAPYAAPVILAAIERALRQAPVPGGLSEERLEAARAWLRDSPGRAEWDWGRAVMGHLEATLAHIDHLARVLHDCGQDGSAAVWAAGREAGASAEREACAKLAETVLPDQDDHYATCDEGYCHECDRARSIAAAIRARASL